MWTYDAIQEAKDAMLNFLKRLIIENMEQRSDRDELRALLAPFE